MSRTYRIRNLPRLIGTAHKFTDGNGRKFNTKFEEPLEREAEALFPYPPGKRFSGSIWRLRYEYVKQNRAQMIAPVANLTNHPWVGWGLITRQKAWHKRHGNRKVRRNTRSELKVITRLQDIEDWDGFLPGKNDGWDNWSLW